jgi:hypothetical protein
MDRDDAPLARGSLGFVPRARGANSSSPDNRAFTSSGTSASLRPACVPGPASA